MRVQEHILTPRYGGAVIGGIHDHISRAYLLSRPGTLINRRHGLEMLGNIGFIGDLLKKSSRTKMVLSVSEVKTLSH